MQLAVQLASRGYGCRLQFFWTGALALIRSTTGESFNGIMHDLFSPDWGDNKLRCCPECGPIIDGVTTTYNERMYTTDLNKATLTPAQIAAADRGEVHFSSKTTFSNNVEANFAQRLEFIAPA